VRVVCVLERGPAIVLIKQRGAHPSPCVLELAMWQGVISGDGHPVLRIVKDLDAILSCGGAVLIPYGGV